jgi:hypothetical protein
MSGGFGQDAFGMASSGPSSGGLFDFSSLSRIFGLSMFASAFTGGGGVGFGESGIRLFVLGLLVEVVRRSVQWTMERFRLRE